MVGRKIKILGMVLGIVCICFVGVVFALSRFETDGVTNSFSLGSVSCKIDETFDGSVKEDVVVENTGGVSVFIRSDIVVNWVSADGSSVYADKPVLDEDYTLDINEEGWFKDENGFYYHKNKVASGGETMVLVKEAKLKEGVSSPKGYYLSVDVISSAVQAVPEKVVSEVWHSVKYNGEKLELVTD